MSDTIKSVSDLDKILNKYDDQWTIFRGVKDAAYHRLIPKIGREGSLKKLEYQEFLYEENFIFRLFKERSRLYLSYEPKNDWEWLSIAQHYGLLTRLLDWTRNILVAAYFAVEKPFDGDSAIYVYKIKGFVDTDTNTNPFNTSEVAKYIPSRISQRITAQDGLFTIHPNPLEEMDNDEIQKILITKDARRSIKKRLNKYGIHRGSLFPDLDGISSHINWLRTIKH